MVNMMKKLTLALFTLSLAGLSALAATNGIDTYVSPVTGRPYPKDAKYTFEQFKARDERVMKKTGGFIETKAEGPLALLVDARAKAKATIDEVARLYKLGTKLDVNIDKTPRGDVSPLAFAQTRMAKDKPLLVVVVVDDCTDLPALSVFPEERIGIVNADKLKGGNDPSAPEMRVDKEIWRAIGFIGGIGFSQQPNDIMQPYYTLKELDDNRYPFIQPMNMAKMYLMCRRFGVKKARRVPYRTAVKEGWAAAPTNDLQKAIWEEVKSEKERGPSKPLTIPPPGK